MPPKYTKTDIKGTDVSARILGDQVAGGAVTKNGVNTRDERAIDLRTPVIPPRKGS